MNRENRNIFLSCADLLNDQVQRSNQICLKLRRTVAHSPEAQQPVLEQIIEKEQKLSNCIKNFVQQGPTHLLDTQLQSTPDENHNPADRSSDGEQEGYSCTITQLLALNDNIISQIETAKESLPDTSDEAFEAFVSKVNSLCKNISMTVVTMQDV